MRIFSRSRLRLTPNAGSNVGAVWDGPEISRTSGCSALPQVFDEHQAQRDVWQGAARDSVVGALNGAPGGACLARPSVRK